VHLAVTAKCKYNRRTRSGKSDFGRLAAIYCVSIDFTI